VHPVDRAGVGEGARTGFANIVTGVLFLLAMFITPLTQIVPTEVAAAALVVVGAMMMSQIKGVELSNFGVMLPVFLTVTIMPFTYSIANGIGAGFVSWVLIRALSGKAKGIHWLLWVVALGFVLFFVALVMLRTRTEIRARRLAALEARERLA